MSIDLSVKVGPQFYRYNEDAFEFIPNILNEYKPSRILIIHGTISWTKAQPFLKKVFPEQYELYYQEYSGECSYSEGERLANIINSKNIDFVIGVGGGKLADLTLYTCHLANVPFGVIPTLASNCASWTPLSVMYKENGLAEGKTEHVNRQAVFLLINPKLVIDAPVNYFIAGIADTLAKWYESDMILEQQKFIEEPFADMARYAALMCKNKILSEANTAILDMKNGVASKEFLHVSEIVIGIAGLVGGLGGKYARNTVAHSMHDALSASLPELHDFLHGEKVAYGILFQLALEGKWEVIDELIPFYTSLNLPKSLTEMNVYPLSKEKQKEVIYLINKKKKVHLLPIEINEEKLSRALNELENYINK